ncbi:MAG: hypothetical protein EGP08_00360 [SAR202 cluster bacterium]|jgi:hypothetical protein|nr:MAG: hypothetical protein EGP08_00360 [SAR202 cluster bacterium]MCH2318842.1 hypothetical protein [SAR202 cluster bacterium]
MNEIESNILLSAKLKGITIPEENVNILVSQMETATGELIKLEELISEEVPLFMPPLLSKVQKPDEG